MSHPTKRIVVKEGDIDEGIIPVVAWLNSFYTVCTYASCQGDQTVKDGSCLPYVTFVCGHTDDLMAIKKTVREAYAKLPTQERYKPGELPTVDGINLDTNFRTCGAGEVTSFHLWFTNQTALQIFIDHLRIKGKDHAVPNMEVS